MNLLSLIDFLLKICGQQNLYYQNIRLLKNRSLMEPQQPKLSSFFDNPHHPYVFYFDISADPPLRVDISLQPRLVLEEALIQAIGKANQLLSNTEISLKKDISLYKPRLTGKNFRPKTDMPALSLYQKICDLKVNQIAIQILKKDQAIIKKVSAQTTSAQKVTQPVQLPQKQEIKTEINKQPATQAKENIIPVIKQEVVTESKQPVIEKKEETIVVAKEEAPVVKKEQIKTVVQKQTTTETKQVSYEKKEEATIEAKTVQDLKSLTIHEKGQPQTK